MGIFRKAVTVTMKKLIDKYKKEIRSKMLVQPGEPLRVGCSIYSCPMYILMVTLNNNSVGVLSNKLSCPKKMCERIKKGVHTCSLDDSEYSIFSGFFVEDDFFSYASLLPKSSLPTLTSILKEETNIKSISAPVDIKEEIEVDNTPLVTTVVSNDNSGFLTIDSILDRLIKDLDRYLEKPQVKSYVRRKDNTLFFTTPIETDLTKITKKIIIDDLTTFDYQGTLKELKIFYEGILHTIENSSCKNCIYEKDKISDIVLACGNCTRNIEIQLLTDIHKEDNYQKVGKK